MPPGVPAPINFGIEAGQAVAKAVADGRSPFEADIPSEVGGPVDVIWDTAYDQPGYADDSIDLPGPTVGDVVDDPREAGPDWLDEAALLVGALLVVGGLLWLVRPLLGIIEEVVAE